MIDVRDRYTGQLNRARVKLELRRGARPAVTVLAFLALGLGLAVYILSQVSPNSLSDTSEVAFAVDDIEAATVATLSATEESTRLSSQATTAARQISITLQQQRGSTEQVAAAMQDIHHVATQVSAGSSQSLSATKDLTRLADDLRRAIEGFRL